MNEHNSENVGTHGSCVQIPAKLSRKSPRAEFHDYSGGSYFITICTRDKEHYFGRIINGEMSFTKIGGYLSVVVGGLKRAVTMFARRNNITFAWQARYHDHIIRGMHDGERITEYIKNNVARWANDCFYGEH